MDKVILYPLLRRFVCLQRILLFIKSILLCPGWVGQWVGASSMHQKVEDSIPSQGTHLARSLFPSPIWEATNRCMSLTWMFLSLSLKSINISSSEDFFKNSIILWPWGVAKLVTVLHGTPRLPVSSPLRGHTQESLNQ